jgi:hypothetical protein
MGEVIKMETPEVKEQKKMSYEELETLANNLYARLQQVEMANLFKRADYLFKVIENSHNFPQNFTDKCVAEIVEFMTVPEVKEAE